MGRLDTKVAIVTGGASGIGFATARRLAAEGARVVIGDRDEDQGVEAVRLLRGDSLEATFKLTDVARSDDVRALVGTAVERYGALHVIFNNAGVAIEGSVTAIREPEWQSVININLGGVWRGMRFGIPEIIRSGGGSIINTASVQALTGFVGWAGYAASKGGIIALTQQAAAEYATQKVRINAIAPGTILTPMNERIFATADKPEQLIEAWNRQHAMGRFGQAEEVAAAVCFLASEDASFITGACLPVDGGLMVKGAS